MFCHPDLSLSGRNQARNVGEPVFISRKEKKKARRKKGIQFSAMRESDNSSESALQQNECRRKFFRVLFTRGLTGGRVVCSRTFDCLPRHRANSEYAPSLKRHLNTTFSHSSITCPCLTMESVRYLKHQQAFVVLLCTLHKLRQGLAQQRNFFCSSYRLLILMTPSIGQIRCKYAPEIRRSKAAP